MPVKMMKQRKNQQWPQAAMLLAVMVGLSGCGETTASDDSAAARTVEVLLVQPQKLELTEALPGRVVPVRRAEVRARVAGIVLSREFTEGSDVQAGQLLFKLDPAPFRLALQRAQAELAKAVAAEADASAVQRRYQQLAGIDAISQQDADAAKANLHTSQAAVLAAKADVAQAELNLTYTEIRAPIAGRIGRALVSEGALVGQNEATELAQIQQLDPVYVDFNQPAQQALLRQQSQAAGHNSKALQLDIVSADGQLQQRGRLLFTDSEVNANTGTVQLRGEFANPDRQLLAGMYVRVLTQLNQQSNAILIPQRAVSRSTDGQAQVWLRNTQGQAELRTVSTGVMQGPLWQITAGLQGGEQLITGGAQQLQPGEVVNAALTQPSGGQPRVTAASEQTDSQSRHSDTDRTATAM